MSIEKAIFFMNKDVKQPLGMKSDYIGTPKSQAPISSTINQGSGANAGILGGYKFIFFFYFTLDSVLYLEVCLPIKHQLVQTKNQNLDLLPEM
jgi:hypothetical protein